MKKQLSVRTTILATLLTGLGLIPADRATAQTFTVLHGFTTLTNYLGWYLDGAAPIGRLVANSSGNTLYGAAMGGGDSGFGTVFAINLDGTGFTTLHSFVGYTNGIQPRDGLILSGNTLYGTTLGGGDSGHGAVFALKTDGSGFTNLHKFTAINYDTYPYTNSDEAKPVAGLVLSSNRLYGTAEYGGDAGNGTVFALNTEGTGFTNLHDFNGEHDGSGPWGVVLVGNTLYGVARLGSMGNGTVFRLSFAPQLTIKSSEANVIVTWPTNVAGFDYSGFTLQSTTNLDSPAVWSTNSSAPVVVNGQNTVTNPMSEPQRFFRLQAP